MSDWWSSLPSFGWQQPPSFGWPQQPQAIDNPTPGRFATVRYNNPGGMYPGSAARAFGSTNTGVIGGGHLIAGFPTPVHGAAANMQNIINGGYVGMPIGAAINRWSGGGRSQVPGFDSSQRITPEMTRNPDFMIPFMKAVASGEAPGNYPMSDDQWRQAYTWYAQGKSDGPAAPSPEGATAGDASGGGKMPATTNSLMDLMSGNARPTDVMGQPTNWGDALASRSNSLIGLGLGLLQPYNPWAGTNPYSNALKGYMAGAQSDEESAQNAWKRGFMERQLAQSGQSEFQKVARDLNMKPGSPEFVDLAKKFYLSKLGETPTLTSIEDPMNPGEKINVLFNPRAPAGQQVTDLFGRPIPGAQPTAGPPQGQAPANSPVWSQGGGAVGYGQAGVGAQGFGTGMGGTTTQPSTATPQAPQYRVGPKAQEQEHELRREINQLPEVKRYSEAIPSLRSMVESSRKDSRAADLDFVYGIAKIFDPDSVVREGEMKLATGTQSLPEDVQGIIRQVALGKNRLSEDARNRLLEVAHTRVQQYKQSFDTRMGTYGGLMQRQRINPENVLPGMVDLPELPGQTAPPPATSGPKITRWGTDANGRPVPLP